MCAQAAHIPVHLGSMAYAMRDITDRFTWQEGDMIVLNDPFLGGTHLPDITLIMPVFCAGQRIGFVANRAHHANVGASTPGSMPISSHIDQEGLLISPDYLFRAGNIDSRMLKRLSLLSDPSVGREQLPGDFQAQVSANLVGAQRLASLAQALGSLQFLSAINALHNYAASFAHNLLTSLPSGVFCFTDHLDSDGMGGRDLELRLRLEITESRVIADFTGTASQVAGNINCPLSVTAAAVFYVFRCLMPAHAPNSVDLFAFLELKVPEGCFINAAFPAAVAAGNVETSMRLVDLVLGALAQAIPERIPAASQGTMNNLAMGHVTENGRWDYYETVAGGAGAGQGYQGASAIQCHMTNTLNTPVESLESHYPVVVESYAVREGSGGSGRWRGGNGVTKTFRFLAPASVTLLTERRRSAPWGLNGAAGGSPGSNQINHKQVPDKYHAQVSVGDTVTINTPGGGGWGVKCADENQVL